MEKSITSDQSNMAIEPHPLDPLSPQEISLAAKLLKNHCSDKNVIFRIITLAEPSKKLMIPFLQAEKTSQPRLPPPRVAFVQYYMDHAKHFHQVEINLKTHEIFGKKALVGKHSYTDAVEMQKSEKACLAHPRVQAEINALDLPEEAVVCVESWTYAPDGIEDMKQRIIMCYLYMRLGTHLDSNHFAYPLDICAELNGDFEVMKVLSLPSADSDRMSECSGNGKKFDRKKIHGTSEYHPDLQTERRTTTKPLLVQQPEGPSFTCDGNLLIWEKWRMRIGFNYREGLTIHDVSYDGRDLFYRLSLSEMFVPYGDSRSPYPRKAAFDLGNNGAGVNANNLQLGCDCLGSIKYFDTYHHTLAGDPVKMPNVVCCHEIDDGILWKHTNYRTNNAIVTRSRMLVLQTIITVGNYEYIFAFQFTQAAEINYEVRATGILSTNPIDIGDSVPYGTVVAPGVMAPYHQHLFSLRIDPSIDGQQNSLLVEESHAMPINDPAVHNPIGVGYTTTKSIVEQETPLDTDVTKARIFKIINENVLNPITNTPVGYKLVPHYSQMLLADPSSFHAKRSEFTTHALWVTKYEDRDLYSAGEHTMQSLGGDGIASKIASRGQVGVRNEDIVLWHTFGTTHNPRVEDWPVMPVEKMMVTLKPVNLFSRSPAMDVPISKQEVNGSVLVDGCCDGK
ncbi:amine oxidase-2 [Coleophoma cylindrospora]|uniref:Amine oxidase n=1 Tax=Coleophoma cylindrospora TaxID=1849047 RepID=A0A3D8QFR9_9HELO|nr:amine oxidase-2 [Coleophoma cylindrospora]